MHLRVLTANIFGHHGDWPARRDVLRDSLLQLEPDIIAFQETMVLENYDQLTDLLPSDYVTHHQGGRSADGCGASIASSIPLGTVSEYPLPRTERMDPSHPWTGSLALATLTVAGHPFLLAHMKPTWQRNCEYERLMQARTAAETIEQIVAASPAHVILLGDFDATPESDSVRLWRGQAAFGETSVSYEDTWATVHPGEEGHTFTNANPLVAQGDMPFDRGRRIDYVMIRNGPHGPTLEILDCQRVFTQPRDGVWASDHFGVMATFNVEPMDEQS